MNSVYKVTCTAIELRLYKSLKPIKLIVIDCSKDHSSHTGLMQGSHFKITIVSHMFSGKSCIDKHRMVYDSLSDIIGEEGIHALSIKALTPIK